jgi:urocanate hydratase
MCGVNGARRTGPTPSAAALTWAQSGNRSESWRESGGSGAGADLGASTQKIACGPQRVEEYSGLREVLLRDCVRGVGGGQHAADDVSCQRVEERGDHGGGGGKCDIEDCD